MSEFKIIRFDLQVLNKQGAPIDQYNVPKYDLKRVMDKIIKSLENDEVYAINLRKAQEELVIAN